MIRIVIVDDHPAIRRMLRQLLSQSEEIRIVAEASNGKEALDSVREHSPDVITLDLMMNEMNGLEVLERLRTFPRPPKVVVISLYDAPQLMQRAIEDGADAYIPKKELNPERLIETVKELAEMST